MIQNIITEAKTRVEETEAFLLVLAATEEHATDMGVPRAPVFPRQ